MGRTRTRTAAGIVLDAGALIALDRGNKRMIALLHRALAQRRTIRVPAGVVGQAWRDGRVQVTLARFLRSLEVEIVPLDEHLARSCGELCGAVNSADVIDASVVILAREWRDPIVTSDPNDLRRLVSGSPLYSCLKFARAARLRFVGACCSGFVGDPENTLKSIGESDKTNTLFLSHSPGAVRDVSDQILQSMLVTERANG